jgi:hypothetical protein
MFPVLTAYVEWNETGTALSESLFSEMKVHIRILEEGFQDISLTHEINSSLQ